MPEQLLAGFTKSLVNVTTATTTSGVIGAVFNLAAADSYAFIVDVGAITGTSPTLDIEIEYSVDNGTTFYPWVRFAQMTATGQRRIVVQPIQGRGEAGTEAAVTLHGTNSALNANSPAPVGFSNTSLFQAYASVGGTSPSIATIKLWLVAAVRATAV